jgi:hypothetical protein
MQVTGDKAAVILGVGGGVSSAGAGAGTIGIVKVGTKVGIAVGAEAGIEVGAEAGMATAEEIRRTGSIIGVFERFKVKVGSSGKS